MSTVLVMPAAEVVFCPACGSDDVGCWAGNDTDREDQADYFGCENCKLGGVTTEYVDFVADVMAREPARAVRERYGNDAVDAVLIRWHARDKHHPVTVNDLNRGPVVLTVTDERGKRCGLRITRQTDADGHVFVELDGLVCDLEGAAPCVYYVVAHPHESSTTVG